MAILEVRDLYAGYYRDLDVLRGVSLSVDEGRIVAVLGANGVGKSTLLKVVAGFVRPSSGSIRLAGREIGGTAPHRLVGLGVSHIPQQRGIFAHMTVEENILMGAWSFRGDRARVRERLERCYERFPALREKRRRPAWQLSGGQQRMVEIGRSLMADPKVLLVDEPTAGLATQLWTEVYRMLVQLRDEGHAVLLVDQQIRQALAIADHVYVLDVGRNRFDGRPSEFADVERSFWL